MAVLTILTQYFSALSGLSLYSSVAAHAAATACYGFLPVAPARRHPRPSPLRGAAAGRGRGARFERLLKVLDYRIGPMQPALEGFAQQNCANEGVSSNAKTKQITMKNVE